MKNKIPKTLFIIKEFFSLFFHCARLVFRICLQVQIEWNIVSWTLDLILNLGVNLSIQMKIVILQSSQTVFFIFPSVDPLKCWKLKMIQKALFEVIYVF